MVQLGEKPESLDCSQLTRKFGLVTLVGIPESLDWSHLAGSQKVWTSPTWRDSRKFGLVLLGWISNRLDWSHLAGSHKVWRKVLDVPILRDLRKSELALHGRILEFFSSLAKSDPRDSGLTPGLWRVWTGPQNVNGPFLEGFLRVWNGPSFYDIRKFWTGPIWQDFDECTFKWATSKTVMP